MEKTSIHASLTLVGDIFDIDYVTSTLGVKPDRVRKKGEIIRSGPQVFDHTEWGIHISEAESLDTSTHLDPIFDFIEQNCDTLKELYILLLAD
jgi:hypothetical protein